MTPLKRLFLSYISYILLSVFLAGCATTSSSRPDAIKETVRLDGVYYVSLQSLCGAYALDFYHDPVTRKVELKKGAKKVSLMPESAVVLLNETVSSMEKEAKVYRGEIFIPRSFARRSLLPFFKEAERVKETTILPSCGAVKNVIIDAGHGGKDPGAIGRSGLREKDVVLDIAKILKRELTAMGINVILTRSEDRFISLAQRADIANSTECDFFISIHANASRSRWAAGVEVFYLSETADDSARSYNASRNYDISARETYSGQNTEAILWDLKFTENRRQAISLARAVCSALSAHLSQKNRGSKPAKFFVLKTNVPAILIEVGFLSNTGEERQLREYAYREKIAAGIVQGIARHNQVYFQSYVRN